jgi:hypothetical protein
MNGNTVAQRRRFIAEKFEAFDHGGGDSRARARTEKPGGAPDQRGEQRLIEVVVDDHRQAGCPSHLLEQTP